MGDCTQDVNANPLQGDTHRDGDQELERALCQWLLWDQ
ncbi:hypothetical protein chiPu_0025353, partial [Chiloscyllium punctatum]|nr:hypothetical protein [Chiloscyllium punctatum]